MIRVICFIVIVIDLFDFDFSIRQNSIQINFFIRQFFKERDGGKLLLDLLFECPGSCRCNYGKVEKTTFFKIVAVKICVHVKNVVLLQRKS
jgi:hypothetical protein